MNVRWEPFSGIQQRGGQLLRRRRLGRGHAGGCPEEPLAGGAVGGKADCEVSNASDNTADDAADNAADNAATDTAAAGH